MPASAIWSQIGAALAAPIEAVTSANSRLFWGYLVTAGVIALAVHWRRARSEGGPSRLGWSWLNHSGLHFDLRFMIVRAVLDSFVLGGAVLSTVALARGSYQLVRPWVEWGQIELAPALALGLVTALSFIAEDAARYLAHRAFHAWPVLWQFHQVHHSAELLTPLTIYRTHPVEGLVMSSTSALAIGITVGVGAALLGAPLAFWQIAGVHGLSVLWNALGSNLRHSHVWLVYPAWLSRWLISPADHQVHHARDRRYHDANFGAVFSCWDRWANTYVAAPRRLPPNFEVGLDPEERNHRQSLLSALLAPFSAATGVVMRRRRALRS